MLIKKKIRINLHKSLRLFFGWTIMILLSSLSISWASLIIGIIVKRLFLGGSIALTLLKMPPFWMPVLIHLEVSSWDEQLSLLSSLISKRFDFSLILMLSKFRSGIANLSLFWMQFATSGNLQNIIGNWQWFSKECFYSRISLQFSTYLQLKQ